MTTRKFQQLPEPRTWPGVDKLCGEWRALVAEQRELGHRKTTLEDCRADAVAKDNAAFAEIVRGKGEDPGTPALDKWTAEHEATTRRLAAVDTAIRDVEAAIVDWMKAQGPKALGELREQLAKADERYLAAIGDLEAAAIERGRILALTWWIEAAGRRQYAYAGRVPADELPGMIARNDAPYTAPTAIAALREVVASKDATA